MKNKEIVLKINTFLSKRSVCDQENGFHSSTHVKTAGGRVNKGQISHRPLPTTRYPLRQPEIRQEGFAEAAEGLVERSRHLNVRFIRFNGYNVSLTPAFKALNN